jgi:hypothetical protein
MPPKKVHEFEGINISVINQKLQEINYFYFSVTESWCARFGKPPWKRGAQVKVVKRGEQNTIGSKHSLRYLKFSTPTIELFTIAQ